MNTNGEHDNSKTLYAYSATITILVCVLIAVPAFAADPANVVQVDWDTRTASCPAKVAQSTNVTIRVTDINDLLVDFRSGETAQYQLRAKGTPMSAVPAENLFLGTPQVGGVRTTEIHCDDPDALQRILDKVIKQRRDHASESRRAIYFVA